MRGYLFDTNHVSKAVRQNSPLRHRIYDIQQHGLRVGTCIPVLCEVESGRLNVSQPDAYRKGLNSLLRKILLWPLSEETAKHFGEIDQYLRRRGRVLSQVDIMLAALCREFDLTLVTTDKDFAALTQVTLLRAIFDFFAGGIARKSFGDGAWFVGGRCSEDLVS